MSQKSHASQVFLLTKGRRCRDANEIAEDPRKSRLSSLIHYEVSLPLSKSIIRTSPLSKSMIRTTSPTQLLHRLRSKSMIRTTSPTPVLHLPPALFLPFSPPLFSFCAGHEHQMFAFPGKPFRAVAGKSRLWPKRTRSTEQNFTLVPNLISRLCPI
jgi:hypothetical protein